MANIVPDVKKKFQFRCGKDLSKDNLKKQTRMHPVVLKAKVVMKTCYSLSCNQAFNGLYDCLLSNKSSFFKTKTLDIRKYDKYNNCPGLCVFYVYNIP